MKKQGVKRRKGRMEEKRRGKEKKKRIKRSGKRKKGRGGEKGQKKRGKEGGKKGRGSDIKSCKVINLQPIKVIQQRKCSRISRFYLFQKYCLLHLFSIVLQK